MKRLLATLLLFASSCPAAPACTESLEGLRALMGDPSFPLRWRETTMGDGHPLLLSILEREGALFLTFSKADHLWVEGAVAVCPRGAEFAARFTSGKPRLGAAAHWALRMTLSGAGEVVLARIAARRIRIAVGGWNGTFVRDD